LTGPGQVGPGENDPSDPDPAPVPDRLGMRTFSLEGRHAPGLYLVGWLSSLLGVATIFVVLLAQPKDLAGAILLGAGTFLLTVGLGAAAGSQAIERQAAGRLAYRGPSPFLLFGATVALTLFVELLSLAPLGALDVPPDSALAALVGLLILNLSATVLIALFVVGSGSLSWREMGVPLPGPSGWHVARLAQDLVIGMALAIPILFLTGVLGALLIQLVGASPSSPLPAASTPAEAALNLFSGVVIAPLGEELFYRGFSTTAWVRDLGVRSGIVRAALLFAVAHVLTLPGTPATALIAFLVRIPIALALGWIFVRRGSLAASFGMHAMFNAIPLVLVGLSVS
jgi:uncharacterized protein